MACACLDALAGRQSEQAVRNLLTRVAESFTVESLRGCQAYGCFDRVKAMAAGGRAAAMLEEAA